MHYDPELTCPYNEAHRIRRSRMQFHLTKCSVQYPCAKKKICPFDASHHVNPKAYKNHVETCPARETVIDYKLINEEAQVGLENMVPIDAAPVMAHNYAWD